jgi:hypothetical protein
MVSQVNEKKKERKKERRGRKEKEERKKKKVRSLDEWIQQVRKTRRQVFLYKAYYAKH